MLTPCYFSSDYFTDCFFATCEVSITPALEPACYFNNCYFDNCYFNSCYFPCETAIVPPAPAGKVVIVGKQPVKVRPKRCLVYSEEEVRDNMFLLPRGSGAILAKVTCDKLTKNTISRRQITPRTNPDDVVVLDRV